jgi:hypothetical protein
MTTTFHIIDSISQDVEGDTVFKGYFTDEEQRYKKKKAASNEEAPKDPARRVTGKAEVSSPSLVSSAHHFFVVSNS